MLAGAKGLSLLWPYSLMQLGMNANRETDLLAGKYGLFFLSCLVWLGVFFFLAGVILKRRDVRA